MKNRRLWHPPRLELFLTAVVLLIAAIFILVAVDWYDTSRIGRLALITLTIIATLIAAGAASSQKRNLVAGIAAVLAVCAFGGALLLIAQMYYLSGDWSLTVFTWLVGAALIAVVLPSPSALSLTFAILLFWLFVRATGGNIFNEITESLNPWFLPIWLVLTIVGYHQRWIGALKLAISALCMWLFMTAGFLAAQFHECGAVLYDAVLIGLAMFGGLLMAISWVADHCFDGRNSRIAAMASVALYGGWVLIIVTLFQFLSISEGMRLSFLELFEVSFFNLASDITYWGKMNNAIWNSSGLLAVAFSLFAALYARNPKKLPLRYGLTLPMLIIATPLTALLLVVINSHLNVAIDLSKVNAFAPFDQQRVVTNGYAIIKVVFYLNALAIFIWGVLYGNHQSNRPFVILTLIGFLLSLLSVYLGFLKFIWDGYLGSFGDLLNVSLLFLQAGLVIVGYGIIAYWSLNRKFKEDTHTNSPLINRSK